MSAQWGRLRAAIDKLSPDWARALRVVCDDLQAGRELTPEQCAALGAVTSAESPCEAWDIAYVVGTLAACGPVAWIRADVLDALACAERAQ